LTVSAIIIVAAGLYFIVNLGPGGPTSGARPDLKASLDFASLTEEGIKKAGPTEVQSLILKLASAEWANDPFLGRKLKATEPAPVAAASAQSPVSLAYTGFVIAAQGRLAVINGMEYQVGEVVLGSDLLVQSIDPQNVVVKQLGSREIFNLPFTGEVLR